MGALRLAGMGGAVLIEERRKRIQKQEDFRRLEQTIDLDLKRAREYPEFASVLLPALNYGLQTRSILQRGDASIDAVQTLRHWFSLIKSVKPCCVGIRERKKSI